MAQDAIFEFWLACNKAIPTIIREGESLWHRRVPGGVQIATPAGAGWQFDAIATKHGLRFVEERIMSDTLVIWREYRTAS